MQQRQCKAATHLQVTGLQNPLPHNVLAVDDGKVNLAGHAVQQGVDVIMAGAGKRERVGTPPHKISSKAGGDLADVVAAEVVGATFDCNLRWWVW